MKHTPWIRASLVLVAAAAAAISAGCSPQASPAARPAINDKFYTVTPDALTVKAGPMSGAVSAMKVLERVEEGTGRIDTAAKLQGTLVLKNASPDQAVRVVGGKIGYFDTQGKRIDLEKGRTDSQIKLSSAYGSSDRLDPGQDATYTFEVDFPAEALQGKRLKDIRIDLAYLPSPYKMESLAYPVAISVSPK